MRMDIQLQYKNRDKGMSALNASQPWAGAND
jgi:hypothetical protein